MQQLLIALDVGPEVEAYKRSDPATVAGLRRLNLRGYTERRQAAVENGASDEADPRWAVPALLETWCIAGLTDFEDYLYMDMILEAWLRSVGVHRKEPSTEKLALAPLTPGQIFAHSQEGKDRLDRVTPEEKAHHEAMLAKKLEPPSSPTPEPVAPAAVAPPVVAPAAAPVKFGCEVCGKIRLLTPDFMCSRSRCPLRRSRGNRDGSP